MSIEKLERVIWRVRESCPGQTKIKKKVFEQAIIKECGYDPRTYQRIISALVKLDFIRKQKKSFVLTNRDI